MEPYGGREAFVVTGEPGCMVRAQLPPFELFDLKYAMGSSIGLAAGLARTATRKKVVALAGDSALLHTGLAELIDAALAGVSLLVVVLANQTTALSGGQAHAASGYDIRGRQRRPLDLAALVRAAGAAQVRVIDPQDERATRMAFEEAMGGDGLAVVIATRACPRSPAVPASPEG
jgi:indolepyruvate ferredoxin oxidoreductase alpha subunit